MICKEEIDEREISVGHSLDRPSLQNFWYSVQQHIREVRNVRGKELGGKSRIINLYIFIVLIKFLPSSPQ